MPITHAERGDYVSRSLDATSTNRILLWITSPDSWRKRNIWAFPPTYLISHVSRNISWFPRNPRTNFQLLWYLINLHANRPITYQDELYLQDVCYKKLAFSFSGKRKHRTAASILQWTKCYILHMSVPPVLFFLHPHLYLMLYNLFKHDRRLPRIYQLGAYTSDIFMTTGS